MTTKRPYVVVALLLIMGGCSAADESAAPPPPAPQIVVARPIIASIGDAIEATGTVAPSSSVDVTARVAGFVRSKEFRDGSFVQRGQVLYRLEPDSLAAQVKLNAAQASFAQEELARQKRLLAEDATARVEVERAASEAQQAAANLQLARINLGYTTVRAPFSGWVSEGSVDVGAYVGGNSAPNTLATVQRLDPIHVDFTLGEREVLRILAAQGSAASARGQPVMVGLQGDEGYPYRGTLIFASKGVDTATGSLQARAVVDNGIGQRLLPGLFARVKIESGETQRQMLVPARAVQSDPLGDFVLLAGPDGKVRRREVKTGADYGGNRVITDGLRPNDLVVIEGLNKVRIGEKAKVRVRKLPSATPR